MTEATTNEPGESMRIAHFTNTYLPVMSGVVRSVSTFRQGQTALGHTVFIFAQDTPRYKDKEPYIFRYPALNIPVRNYPVTIPVSPLIDWVLPILKPQVIHAHHPAPMGTAASDKADKLGVPLIFTHHTRYQDYMQYMGLPDELMRDILKRLLGDYMQKCHHIIAPSQSIKEMITKVYGIRERMTVIPTGIDRAPYEQADGTAVRHKLGWQDDEIVIVSIGRLADEKNFSTLIRAAGIVMQAHDNVRLALIGEGPDQKDLRKIAEKLGVAQRVDFLGRVPYEDIPAYLKAADIFGFASITETQGLVTMEALAAGLPVAAVDATGTSDIVTHEKDGLLTANKPEALADALKQMITRPDMVAQFREEALVTAQTFDQMATAGRMMDVYAQAIEDKAAGRHVIADEHKPIFKIDWDKLLDGLRT